MLEDFASRRNERKRLLDVPENIPQLKRQSRERGKKAGKFRKSSAGPSFKRLSAFLSLVGKLCLLGLLLFGLYQIVSYFLSSDAFAPNSKLPEVFPYESRLLEAVPQPSQSSLKLTHYVKSGETLGAIFSEYGLSQQEAAAIAAEMKEVGKKGLGSSSIRPGQKLLFALGADGQVELFSSEIAKNARLEISRLRNVTEEQAPQFKTEVIQAPSSERERVVTGEISSSFAADARSAGLPYAIIDDLVDVLGDKVSFNRDLRKGDRFVVIYQDEILEDGSSLGNGTILAAILEVASTKYTAIRYVGSDGTARYFDENAEVLGSAFLRYPLKFSRISSHFTKSRFHPVLKRRRPHNGVDFAAPTGTPVRSVGDGVVSFAGRKGGAGKMVKIRHSDRYSTAYLHLSRITPGMGNGKRIKRGDIIGKVGMTGWATGPHLHYSLYDRGKYVDPLKAKLPKIEKLAKGQKIERSYLERALFTLNHYQEVDLQEAFAAAR